MRKRYRFVGITVTLVVAAGCVSDNMMEPAPLVEPHPVYQLRRPAPLVGRQPPVRQRRTVATPRITREERTWFPRGKPISNRWTYIVLHHSGTACGGARLFDKHHRQDNGWDELGYHFVIGNGTSTPDGFVEVGSRWQKQKHGAHCKTPDNYFNDHGIGICLVGDFTKSRPTRKQLASLDRLLRFLTEQCHIDVDHITTHKDVTHKTQCPGWYFHLAGIRRALTGPRSASFMP